MVYSIDEIFAVQSWIEVGGSLSLYIQGGRFEIMYSSAQRVGLSCLVSPVEGLENVFDVLVEIAISAIESVVFKSGTGD